MMRKSTVAARANATAKKMYQAVIIAIANDEEGQPITKAEEDRARGEK